VFYYISKHPNHKIPKCPNEQIGFVKQMCLCMYYRGEMLSGMPYIPRKNRAKYSKILNNLAKFAKT